MKKTVIGIDVSSRTLDLSVIEHKQVHYATIENKVKSIVKFLKAYDDTKTIIAMENTGRYNWYIYEALEQFSFEVYVISPLHLSKSLGLVRGKNDKIDALRICQFVQKNKAELTAWQPTAKNIQCLKVLLSERNSRIKTKRQLLARQNDYKLMKTLGLDKELLALNKQQIKALEKQIKKIEHKINDIIESDQKLKNQQQLIKTIPGVGNVLSWTIIGKTEGFSKFTNPRKFACFAGVVPFEYQSGSSIYRKPKLSMFADKELKSILHLAAMSAIRLDNDLRKYYVKKVKEGKNKMSVLNAVRNKIIHRIFAIIKNQTAYKNNLVLS